MTLAPSPRVASRAFFDEAADHDLAADGSRRWWLRGGNFVVAYGKAGPGAVIDQHTPDEHMLYVIRGSVDVTAAGRTLTAGGRTIVIVPPGGSSLTATDDSELVQVFSMHVAWAAAKAMNADAYHAPAADYAPCGDGDLPRGGSTLRAYRIDDFAHRPMRLFRSQNLMMNVFDHAAPRPVTALTPHSHDDFEQGSLAVAGEWTHHLRRPWTPDMREWADDEHLALGSPSLTIIPARMIHTSRSTSPGYAQLLDIFAPPRRDFLEKGLVCNADEYPPLGPDTGADS